MKNNIKCILLLLLIGIVVGGCSPSQKEGEQISGFEINKGVNIAHWLSQSNKAGLDRKNYIKKEEIQWLSEQGFDHLRLPVDEEHLFMSKGKFDKEAVQLIHNFISWCQEFGLRVIFDMHIIDSHNFGSEERPLWKDEKKQDEFVNMWLAIDKEFKHYPDSLLAYELLNEPVAQDNSDWSNLAYRTVIELRKSSPYKMILLGPNWFNNVAMAEQLKVPENDVNLMISFHYYEPYALTHYNARWTDFAEFDCNVTYPGELIEQREFDALSPAHQAVIAPYKRVYNRETIEEDIKQAVAVANNLNIKLHCGEFGCLPNVEDDARYAWYSDLTYIFSKYGIAYTSWEYKEIFGFCNRDGSLKDEKLLNLLLNKL